MFTCNLQGLGSAISCNLGGIFGKTIIVCYAATDGAAPLVYRIHLGFHYSLPQRFFLSGYGPDEDDGADGADVSNILNDTARG